MERLCGAVLLTIAECYLELFILYSVGWCFKSWLQYCYFADYCVYSNTPFGIDVHLSGGVILN